jgi:hypothetical protein
LEFLAQQEQLALRASTVQLAPRAQLELSVSPEQQGLQAATAPLVRQAPLVPMEQQARWACLEPPGLQELQVLTVQQEPPASLEFLVPLELLVSQVPLVLLESSVFQERQAPPESRAVMVQQARQELV